MNPIEPNSEKILASTNEQKNGIEEKKFTPVQQPCNATETFGLLATMPTIEEKVESNILSADIVSKLAETSPLPEHPSPTAYIPIEPAIIDHLSQTLWSLCVSIERLQNEAQIDEVEKDRLARLSHLTQAAYDEVNQVLAKLNI